MLLLLLLALCLPACTPVATPSLAPAQAAVTLRAGQSVGQTFWAEYGGLQGIELSLAPRIAGAGRIIMHLRASPQATDDLATVELPASAVQTSGSYTFSFSPRHESSQHGYYMLLEMAGDARVRVGTLAGSAYLQGAAYRGGEPLDAQLSFRLSYAPEWLLLGMLRDLLGGTGLVIVAVLLFVLPGWALLQYWPGAGALSWAEKLGLACGLSLALYPLLLLWTSLVGPRVGVLYAWLPMLVSSAMLAWRAWRTRGIGLHFKIGWANVALLAAIALIVAVRLWAVRSLPAPLWGDSVHHAMIAQLIVDHGGLFDSWQPYADLQTLAYHFGFHANTAVLHWFSGMDVPQATLWMGQILNALAALALYPLAQRMARNRWAGVLAVLLAGLCSPMPMYYTNWGRYTQLAGQVILPTAIWLAWALWDHPQRDARLLALACAAWSALAITHYRILVFAGLFVAAYALLYARPGRLQAFLSRAAALATCSVVLALPWLWHIYGSRLFTYYASQVTTSAQETTAWVQQYNSIGDLLLYLPLWLWLLLLGGLLWGGARRDRPVLLIAVWWLLVLFAANPQWLRLPGEGILSNFAVLIALYIPAALIGGCVLVWLTTGVPHCWKYVVACLIVALGLWGASERLSDVRPGEYALVTWPDVRAASWLRQNTSQNARFVVNSFFAYGDRVIVGSDGGWWLPLLAQRHTTLPPLNYESEQGPVPDYVEWINALPRAIKEKGLEDPDVLNMLTERGVTHIYIGQRQGRVNYSGPDVLQPGSLLSNPHLRPIYHQDRVWIFQIQP
jgi:hypothetical protein